MPTLTEALRQVVGQPQFIDVSGVLDYGAVMEYFASILILCLVVCCIFKLIGKVFVR